MGLYHHGGPLPWDDDVDVLMTEADTLKLIELVVNQRVNNISYTGISSQIRTKLRDWAVWQARTGCYSQAALSSYDSKMYD